MRAINPTRGRLWPYIKKRNNLEDYQLVELNSFLFQNLASRVSGTSESNIWIGANYIHSNTTFEWKSAANDRSECDINVAIS